MLCRALLAAVVLSYVLCVLLLSGVQKEDIDAGTLRKLQRHNVNIDDINDQQLRIQCLGKTNIPVTMLTQDITVTEKAIKEKSVTAKKNRIEKEKVRSQAEDSAKLRKIFEYLEYDRKGERRKALKSKDNTSTLKSAPNNKLQSSYSYSSRNQNINIENTSRERSELRGRSVTDKEDEKVNKANINKKLENLINIWQTDMDRITNTTPQESTTVTVINEDTLTKNTKDVEYITKIVEEILIKKKISDLKSANTELKPTNYDSNSSFTEVVKISGAKSGNKTIAPTSYILNNCKLGNFYANNQDDNEKYETFDNDKRLSDGIVVPVTIANDNNYIFCKRVDAKEKEMISDRMHNNEVYNILHKLNQDSQKSRSSETESAIRTLLENKPKTADYSQKINRVKSNIHKKGLNIHDDEQKKTLKNQSEGIISNKQGGRVKTWDIYKEGLDAETARALETALETQSNIYNQMFGQQRDLVQMGNTDIEQIKLIENERHKDIQSALIAHPPTFNYKPSKQDSDLENKDYNMWRFAYTLNNQKQTMEPRENIVINNAPYISKEKSTNALNNKEYDPNLDNQYKRPWFYSEVSIGKLRSKNKDKLNGVFFKPNVDNNLINKESKPRKNIKKKWSPYFDTLDKKLSINEAGEIIGPPVSQKPILIDSYRLNQLNNREISQEVTDNSKIHFVGTYQNENESPNIIKERSGEKFETKKHKKMSQSHCQTMHETRFECLPDVEYKKDWAYFRNKQIEKQKTNMKEHSEESEYFNYQFPPRPRTTNNRYVKSISEENIVNQNGTKDNIKLPAFPPNVIIDIANSIKEIVLKDLKTTAIPTTTTLSTTTSSPINTTTTMTTTTRKTTITTSTMTTSTIKSTEGTSTAATEQPLKIQDASKALEKIMEMFEKIRSIKDKIVKHENITYGKDIGYDRNTEATTQTILNHQEQPAQEKTEKLDNQTPNVPQRILTNTDNRESFQQQLMQYIPQAVQMKTENGTAYVLPALPLRGVNRLPYPQSLQSNPESRAPYFPPALTSENRLPYDPLNLHSNPENRSPYFPPALQIKIENRTPYTPQSVQQKAEKGNRLPCDSQTSQSKIESSAPYFPVGAQMRAENRIPYVPQAVQMKTENNSPRDAQTLQSMPENLTPYFPRSLQLKSESRVSYDPQLLQRSRENSLPYDQQPLHTNLGNRVPYDSQPLQSNPDNSVSYLSQPLQFAPNDLQLKTDNRIPYDTPPLERNSKRLYRIKKPYYNSKLELDPYQDKEVLEPIQQKSQPRKYAITVQTNSGEIAPLKITVQKPIIQTIVLTTKSPKKVEQHSDETFNGRKPKSISTRHQVDKLKKSETSDNSENNQYFSRHRHRDTDIDHPKSRKIKKEREVIQKYKPREHQEIERFHEKLERGDAWSQYEEENIAKRMQRPIIKNTNYDDTHFQNFLQTQQKVNAMLEKILASSKNKPISTEVM